MKQNSNHELDLNLVKEDSYLTNKEVKLDETQFLTTEKVNHFGSVLTKIFKKETDNTDPRKN